MSKFVKTEYFTGKGALGLDVISPKSEKVKTEKGEFLAWERGAVLVYGASAIAERKYDWAKKVTLALTPREVAQILKVGQSPFFGAKNVVAEVKAYHDTGKGTPTEGQKVKSLLIQMTDSTKTPGVKVFGFLFSQKDKGVESKAAVYLDWVDFSVFLLDLQNAYNSVTVVD